MTPVIRVVVADDQELARSGVAMILDAQSDISVVGEAADGRQGIDLAREHLPDVALVDIQMPVLDGIEATRQIVADERLSGVHVVILTNFGLDEYVFNALRAGASGFLLKDVPPDDLVGAVRAVARGDALIEPRMTRRLLTEFARQPESRDPSPPKELSRLTPRELDVFREVARGCNNAEIAERLYISETTVKSHVAHIFTKLHLRDRIQAVVLAYESGLLPE